MVSISTYGGWAGIAVIGAGYWYLQSRRNAIRPNRPTTQKQVNKSVDTRKEGKSKKQRGEGAQSGAESGVGTSENSQKKKKEKPTNSKIDDTTPANTTTTFDDGEGEDEVDNREFARQFQNAKAGTISTSRPQAASRQKSVKQSQAKDRSTSGNTNGADTSSNDFSSNAGVDGDDDLSASNSPAFGATKAQPLRSGDVSDMLESPPAGPSVLRITEPAQSLQPKKDKRLAKVPEVAETKKQRQHRKKNEERKAAREEEEKERRVLMEKQRRTAREAEGRAAKDGSTFMAANAPSSSVWTAPPAIVNGQSDTNSKGVELLDTYEPNTNRVSNSSAPKTDASDDKKTNREWDKALPSEEEQMRLLEEETAWNTVTSKKGKRKGGDSEQVAGQKLNDNPKLQSQAVGSFMSTKNPSVTESNIPGPVTIVGDSSIDISNFSYKGEPANAVLENGDGHEYGYTMADDEWEVA
jgi:hypothetical protein